MLLAMNFDDESIVQRKWKRFGPFVFKKERKSWQKDITDASHLPIYLVVSRKGVCANVAQS